jgi:phosphatidylserine decarboxylase
MMTNYGKDRTWPFAEGGGGTIAFFTLLLATAVFLWFQFTNWAAGLFLLLASFLWLLVLYFFRDPNRAIEAKSGLVLGPGDGEVVEISTMTEDRFLQAEVIRMSMFLDITDVHVQRVPLAGKVTLVQRQPGKFLQAFKPEASEVNEFIAMVTESEGYGRILTKQIAGIVARRCLNYLKPGDVVQTGQRFGLIRFSSRVDLFLPPTAHMLVKVGDKIIGGVTPIAQLEKTDE